MTPRTFRSAFERVLEIIVIALVTTLAVLIVVAVVFRKAGASLVWYDEVASVLLAWLTYYGASLAALKQSHIGFPKLIEAAAPEVRRFLIVTRGVVVVGFFLLVAWSGWQVLYLAPSHGCVTAAGHEACDGQAGSAALVSRAQGR